MIIINIGHKCACFDNIGPIGRRHLASGPFDGHRKAHLV
jgi:hypothetical protein